MTTVFLVGRLVHLLHTTSHILKLMLSKHRIQNNEKIPRWKIRNLNRRTEYLNNEFS